jgi:hypothetical protein
VTPAYQDPLGLCPLANEYGGSWLKTVLFNARYFYASLLWRKTIDGLIFENEMDKTSFEPRPVGYKHGTLLTALDHGLCDTAPFFRYGVVFFPDLLVLSGSWHRMEVETGIRLVFDFLFCASAEPRYRVLCKCHLSLPWLRVRLLKRTYLGPRLTWRGGPKLL